MDLSNLHHTFINKLYLNGLDVIIGHLFFLPLQSLLGHRFRPFIQIDALPFFLSLCTRYLTKGFLVVVMLILDLLNLHLDTKTTIPDQSVHILWLFLLFSYKIVAILDLAWSAALDS